jgi:hypothetical protein
MELRLDSKGRQPYTGWRPSGSVACETRPMTGGAPCMISAAFDVPMRTCLRAGLLMNYFVSTGASQLVAMEIRPDRFTLAVDVGLTVVVGTVDARMVEIDSN